MQPLQETLKRLETAAAAHKRVLVAYSGGKDSIATLDLCVKTFGIENVECFFMYFIPGLRCVEDELDKARKRWGVKIHQYPHWVLHKALAYGFFTNPWYTLDDLGFVEWKLDNIYALAMAETDIGLIAHGRKRSDSKWARRVLATWGDKDTLLYPLIGWSKLDVLAYLTANNLWVPGTSGRNATGVDLSTPSLLWLHDNHPQDFARIEHVFPYVRAVVERRRMFGVD